MQANLDDVQLANRLASDILGQSLDALLPQTRQLLQLTFDFVRQRAAELKQPPRAVRFTQRELREALDWSEFTLRRHLQRLVALEYMLAYRTGLPYWPRQPAAVRTVVRRPGLTVLNDLQVCP